MSATIYHVGPVGDHWEVEDSNGKPIADVTTKEEAIQAAQEAASADAEAEILVHTADGVVEKEIAAGRNGT